MGRAFTQPPLEARLLHETDAIRLALRGKCVGVCRLGNNEGPSHPATPCIEANERFALRRKTRGLCMKLRRSLVDPRVAEGPINRCTLVGLSYLKLLAIIIRTRR